MRHLIRLFQYCGLVSLAVAVTLCIVVINSEIDYDHYISNFKLYSLAEKLRQGVPRQRKPGEIWTRDIYAPGFSHANPLLCPENGIDTKLLIMVLSAPNNLAIRNSIRYTWGHFAHQRNVSMGFIVGKTEDENALKKLQDEMEQYNDLIVSNSMDSYSNLTLKTLSILEWATTYCHQTEFVLKVDDDVFINVPSLLAYLEESSKEEDKPKIIGWIAKGFAPERNKNSKFYVSEEAYNRTKYPDFASGPAYVLSGDIIQPLYETGLDRTYINLEDVFVTAVIAEELGIKRVHNTNFFHTGIDIAKTEICKLQKVITVHRVSQQQQFELWSRLMDGKEKC